MTNIRYVMEMRPDLKNVWTIVEAGSSDTVMAHRGLGNLTRQWLVKHFHFPNKSDYYH